VGLWIEHDFCENDIFPLALAEVSHREVVEVIFGEQNSRSRVVNVQKVLKAVELVSLPQLFHAFVFYVDLISSSNFKHQLGLETTLDVEVQFGFGYFADKFFDVHL
jgi:hypothetical protein